MYDNGVMWTTASSGLGRCFIGVYSINGSPMDLYILAGFGLPGYLMRKLDFPTAPLVMAAGFAAAPWAIAWWKRGRTSRGAELRALLAAGPVTAPGVFNAMAARVAPRHRFQGALYRSWSTRRCWCR